MKPRHPTKKPPTKPPPNIKSRQLVIGNAKFFPKFTKYRQDELMIAEFQKVMYQDRWDLSAIYLSSRYNRLLRYVQQCACKQYVLESLMSKTSPLTTIAHIDFTKLKTLKLSNNKITTIEQIPFLSCPYLTNLSLDENLITSFQPMLKTCFRQLEALDVRKNRFANVDMGRFHTNKKVEFMLDMLNHGGGSLVLWCPQEAMIENIAQFYMKMESVDVSELMLFRLYSFSKKRNQKQVLCLSVRYIKQDKICLKIVDKFSFGSFSRDIHKSSFD